MSYYVVRSKGREGTEISDKPKIYKYVINTPVYGSTYSIPVPDPEPPNPTPAPPAKYKVYYNRVGSVGNGRAIRVWDKPAYTDEVVPEYIFLPVPLELRGKDVRVQFYSDAMFSGWTTGGEVFGVDWHGDGCYAVTKEIQQDIFNTAHDHFGCDGMTQRGWMTILDSRCSSVRVIFV